MSLRIGSRHRLLLGALLAASMVGTASLAWSQPQPQPQPPPQPGAPPGAPPGAAPVQGQPGQPPGRPRLPMQPGQPGMPGQLPPGHPGMPGGRPMPPGARPMPMPARPGGGAGPAQPHKKPAEEHGAPHGAGHCPGHGPLDPPGHFNFGHGLLGVDNEKAPPAGTSGWVPSLWRYENKDNPCDLRNEPPPFLANLINFGVLVFILFRFGRKPIREALRKRKESIMHEIDTATTLKREAKQRLKQYRQNFETLDERLAELKADFAAVAEAEKTRILSEAEERRDRMRRDAEFRIEQELKAARQALHNEAVDGAVGAAEVMIKKGVGSADLDRINDDYLAAIGAAIRSDAGVGSAARGTGGGPSASVGGGAA